MNKLLGNTTSWSDVLKRFKSPVIVIGMIMLILNYLRNQFGWEIPIEFLELILDILIYGGVPIVMGINDSTNTAGL